MNSEKLDPKENCDCVEEDRKELPCQDTRKILAVLGALPIVLSPPYMPSLSVAKSTLVYCIVVYSLLTYGVICSAKTEKILYDDGDRWDAMRNRHLENILAMSSHFLGIYFWIDVPELLTTLKRYEDAQVSNTDSDEWGKKVQFRLATGGPLIYRRKRMERYSYVVAVTLLFLLYIVLYLITPREVRFSVGTTVAYLYGNVLALCATYVWVGFAWAITDAAGDMTTAFYRQLPNLTPSRVYEFRILWLSMRRTLDSMAKFRCTTAIYSMSVMASVYLLYKTTVLVQDGDMVLALGYILYVAFYVGQLTCLVGDVLPKISLNLYDLKVRREIVMMFFVQKSRPSTFVSNISTYIVVLIQFNLAGQTFGL